MKVRNTEPTGLTQPSTQTILGLLAERPTQDMYENTAPETQHHSQTVGFPVINSQVYNGYDRQSAYNIVLTQRMRISSFLKDVLAQIDDNNNKEECQFSQEKLV